MGCKRMLQMDTAKLRALRVKKKLSREQLARLAGVSIYTVGRIETGGEGVTLTTLGNLAKALETTIDDLLIEVEEGEAHE